MIHTTQIAKLLPRGRTVLRRLILAGVLSLFLPVAVVSVCAEPIVLQMTLKDLGEKEPVRIEGPVNERIFFFPLPVRIIDPQGAFVELNMRTSARIDRDCNIEIFANDILISQRLVNPAETFTITAPLTPMQPYKLGENFLKITVRVSLRRPNRFDRCEDLITRELWVEVDPTSRFGTRFDDQDLDWLAVSRLPYTLQRRVGVEVRSGASTVEKDLALKLSSWLTYISPRLHWLDSDVGKDVPDAQGGGKDLFIIEPVEGNGPPSIRVVAAGLNRQIFVQASTVEQSKEIWGLLKEMQRTKMPGRSWKIEKGVVPDLKSEQRNFYPISYIEPKFLEFVGGIGDLNRTFGFDTAMFSSGDVDLVLHLEGRHTPVVRVGSALLSVYVNDKLAYTEELKVGSDSIMVDVPLTRAYLQEENELKFTITYFPTSEECRNPLYYFGFQLNENTSLALVSTSPAPNSIFDLVRVARRYFGRGKYQVAIPRDDDGLWRTGIHAVEWIQKMNPRRICEPEYAADITQTGAVPTLMVGFAGSEEGLSGRRIIPISREGGKFDLKTREGETLFQLESSVSAGFWQMAYNRNKQPVFLLDAWGAGGQQALVTLVTQMADLPYMGHGDLVVGDGQTPAYGFETTDLMIKAGSQMRGPVTTFWENIRWWLIIPLWILISGLMIWILKQALSRMKG